VGEAGGGLLGLVKGEVQQAQEVGRRAQVEGAEAAGGDVPVGVRLQQSMQLDRERPVAEVMAGHRQESQVETPGRVPWQRGQVVGGQPPELCLRLVGAGGLGKRDGQGRAEDRHRQVAGHQVPVQPARLAEAALHEPQAPDHPGMVDLDRLTARPPTVGQALGGQFLGRGEVADEQRPAGAGHR
jgi:hypothetical protein